MVDNKIKGFVRLICRSKFTVNSIRHVGRVNYAN